jgi:hypothetical protein
MKRSKLVIFILIIVVVGGGLAVGSVYLKKHFSFTSLLDNFRPKGEQSIFIQALEPKRTDKLFTAFVYMPIIDYKPKGENNENNIKGVCSRQYAVEFGYNDTLQLFNQYHEAACRNDLESMPNPIILASKPEFVERKGDYSQKDCDSFDEKENTSIKQKSHKEIWMELSKNGQGIKVVSNSKKVLAGYLRIYCPATTSNE